MIGRNVVFACHMVFLMAPAVWAQSRPVQDTQPVSAPASAPAGTVLRLAMSQDGLTFTDIGTVFPESASAPALTILPNGRLLLLFDRETLGGGPSEIVVSLSADAGRHWTPAQPIRVADLEVQPIRARHGAFAWMPDGSLRLYFVATMLGKGSSRKPASSRPSDGLVVLSLITSDGLHYALDRKMGFRLDAKADVRITTMADHDGRVHLYLDEVVGTSAIKAKESRSIKHLASREGRRFRDAEPLSVRGVRFIGSILSADQRCRAYVSSDDGVCLLKAGADLRWSSEEKACLPRGQDPAVVCLKDGSFLMVYCARANERSRSLTPLAGESPSVPAAKVTEGQRHDPGSGGTGSAVTFEPFASGAAEGSQAASASPGGSPARLPNMDGSTAQRSAGAAEQAGQSSAQASQQEGDRFAPMADFANPVDYVQWYEQNLLLPPDQNAYYSYGDLTTLVRTLPDGTLNDRYNGSGSYGPPTPWDPREYPEWEASYQATQDLVQLFRTGSQDPRPFSCPVLWPTETPSEDKLLVEYALPSLAGYRHLTKAVLSQAWRAENGAVPPGQMRDALQTCLGNANHLQQGPTLIERLVSVAERGLTEDNARWALQRGVFKSADDIEATLSVLRERDVADPGPAGWISAQHACCMDAIQYAFEDVQPGSDARISPGHLEKLIRVFGGNHPDPEDVEAAKQVTPEYAKAATREIDGYHRRLEEAWRTSFPGPMSKTPDEMAMEVVGKYRLAGAIIPSVSRAYELSRRAEASRRATQLVYNVELYKARNGRYPGSLDELPADSIQNVRTDPFSGGDFAYRMTDSGPRIYSLSINGKDDGGAHSEHWGDAEDKNASDDYVFWPPQK